MSKSVPAAILSILIIQYTIIWSRFDIHTSGPVKQRTLVMQYSRLQPSHCGEQVTSHSTRQDSMFSSMQRALMEPRTSVLKLRCQAPAAKQKLLLSKPHSQSSDTVHNESALVVSVSDITDGRWRLPDNNLEFLTVGQQPRLWKIRITSFRKRTPTKA